MPQHDYVIDNQGGAAFRADVNNALQALAQQNSGPTAPNPSYPYELWSDTSTNPATIRMRNGANTAWIVVGYADTANLGLMPTSGGAMTSGTINDVPIGQQTPASVAGTDISATNGVTAQKSGSSAQIALSRTGDASAGTGHIGADNVYAFRVFKSDLTADAMLLTQGGNAQFPGGIDSTAIGANMPSIVRATQVAAMQVGSQFLAHVDGTGPNDFGMWGDSTTVVFGSWDGTKGLKYQQSDGSLTALGSGTIAIGSATAAGHAVRLDQTLGYTGQTYQDVLASRALNTVYTNTTARPILVFVGFDGVTQEDSYAVSINGGTAVPFTIGNGYGGGVFIVPPGQTYKVSVLLGSPGNPQYWNELR